MKSKTKRAAKRFCSAVLSATTLLSMLTFMPANAVENTAENVTESTEKITTIYESNEIPEGMGATGNPYNGYRLSKDTKIIKSVDDYYKELDVNNLPTSGSVKRKRNTVLPSSVDNSQSKYFPKIGDQGAIGSCTLFAQVYYQFTYTYNKKMDITTTEENTFSPKLTNNYCNLGGTPPETAYNFMKRQGSVTLDMLPYDDDTKSLAPTEEIWGSAIKYRITDYQFFEEIGEEDTQITSADDSDLLPIKTALNNGEILTYTTFAYSFNTVDLKTNDSAPENKKYESEKIVSNLSGDKGGHRMAIVGYNDNIWCDINNNDSVDDGEMGAFKVVNSWAETYANGGFIWVAYDALNKFSSVPDMENTERFRIFEEVSRIEVDPDKYNSDIYLRFTLNTACRDQAKFNIFAERNGTEITCADFPEGCPGGGAFDGSNVATDATLVFPLDRVAPEINSENIEEYTLRIEFSDLQSDGKPTIFKEATIVDRNIGKTYPIDADFPFELDGNSKAVDVQESSLNNTIIYYIGYDNPVVHIKEEGGEWYSAPMTHNMERHGATHKYVFETNEIENIQLYFTDGDNTDDNNGKYFTASNGLNFFKTKNVHEPLHGQYTTDCENILDLGEAFFIDTTVSGGYAPYTYEIADKNLDTGNEKKHKPSDSTYFPLFTSEIGNHVTSVTIRDYADDIYTMYFYYEVKDLPFEFKELSMNSDGTSVTGRELNFKAVTKSENIKNWGPVKGKYNFVIKRGDEVCHSVSKYFDKANSMKRTTTNYLNWTPTQTGTYTITVSTEDGSNEYAEKSLTFEIKDDRIGDVNGDGNIDVKDATAIQMHIAKITDSENFRTIQSDCDKNIAININDATYIQLHIAEYICDDSNVGEIIKYQPETTAPPTTQPTTQPTIQPTTQPVTEPTTVPAKNTVTFTNSFNWGGTIYCYYWSDISTTMTKWPGVAMTYSETNDFGEKMYTFDVPYGATYIIFTNGSAQTTDIPYKGGEVRYYPIPSTDSKGHNLVNTW